MSFIEPPFWARRYGSGYAPLNPVSVEVSRPEDEPLSLEEIKQHLNIDSDRQDDWLTARRVAARLQVEKDLNGACLVQRQFDQYMDRAPHDRVLALLRWPLVSVESIVSFDQDDAEAAFSASDYHVEDGRTGRVILKNSASWPTSLRSHRSIRVRYTAGFTDDDESVLVLPDTYKTAMLMLLGHWFENREAVLVGTSSKEFELAYQSLLSDGPMVMA